MGERIQKVLARAGVASRRQVEAMIEEGRVLVNGKVATIGQPISKTDRVSVDKKNVYIKWEVEAPRVLMYRKAAGTVVTRSDPEGRETVFEHLPRLRNGRWIAVGRLDLNTSGLLLFTDNGELANRLMHPSYEVSREYAVRVLGGLDEAAQKALLAGVELDDGVASFDTLQDAGGEGANHWYRVQLSEGRNRIVRRLMESQGVQVSRLMRTHFATLEMDKAVRPERCRELTDQELKDLMELVGLEPPARSGPSKAQRFGTGRGRPGRR